MLLSYVLRLVPQALAEGCFAGTVQVIDTGRTVPLASVDELLVVLMPRPRDGSTRRAARRSSTSTPAEGGRAPPVGRTTRTGAGA